MQETLSSLTTSSQSAGSSSAAFQQPIIASVLALYRLPDMSSAMHSANSFEHAPRLQLQQAISQFQQQPDLVNRNHLIHILEAELIVVQNQNKHFVKMRDLYQQQAAVKMGEAKSLGYYLASWKEGLVHAIKGLFGSTDLQQLEKYQADIDSCQRKLEVLTAYVEELRKLQVPIKLVDNELPKAVDTKKAPVQQLDFMPPATSYHRVAQGLAAPSLPVTEVSDQPNTQHTLAGFQGTSSVTILAQPPFPESIALSHLNSKIGFTISAESPDDTVGYAISAGDVDGDGISDILLGAPKRNAKTGSAYLLRGGKDLGGSGTVSLTAGGAGTSRMDGEAVGSQAGLALSIMRNVRAPGESAMLIGAPDYYGFRGRSYLLYGGPQWRSGRTLPLADLDGVSGKKIDGVDYNDFSGMSVGGADVNADGKAELFIGAPGYSMGVGQSYAVFSHQLDQSPVLSLANLSAATGYTIASNSTDQGQLGWSITEIGDFNGDHYPDFAVNAPYMESSKGSVFVVYGGPEVGRDGTILLDDPSSYNGTRFDGENPGDFAGWSVSAVASPHGNYSDLLIGAPSYGKSGRIYLLRGNHNYDWQFDLSNLNSSLGYIMDGEFAGDQAGYAVSSIGAMASDGVPYFAIGAPGYNVSRGRTYVVRYEAGLDSYLNLSQLNGTNGFTVDGEAVYDKSGFAIAGGGDIRGNRGASLLIGAPGCHSGSGCAYAIFGKPAAGPPVSHPHLPYWQIGLIAFGSITGVGLIAFIAYCLWTKNRGNKFNRVNDNAELEPLSLDEKRRSEDDDSSIISDTDNPQLPEEANKPNEEEKALGNSLPDQANQGPPEVEMDEIELPPDGHLSSSEVHPNLRQDFSNAEAAGKYGTFRNKKAAAAISDSAAISSFPATLSENEKNREQHNLNI
jgi:hypothetical protein